MTSYYDANDSEPRDESASDSAARSVRETFASLPFEKKISTMIRIELDMFGDAIDAVISAASKAADSVADALSGKGSETEGQSGQL
jgi:hypothetical protein